MIPNITRGGRAHGVIKYLVSPKKNPEGPGEVHETPHLVAGAGDLMQQWGDYNLAPRYNPGAVGELAGWLEQPRTESKGRVTVPVHEGNRQTVLTPDGGVALEPPRRRDAHVWHCSLSLHPSEQPLTDQEWGRIASEFIEKMGLQETRWLAVRHGLSPKRNDHVHLVVQLVGFDGRSARVHNDRPRSQEACRQLEHDHDLRVLEGREKMRGQHANTPRQRQAAQRLHQQGLRPTPVPRRDLLERAVRAAALASASEADFIRRMRAQGYVLRPRFEAGTDDRVTGFSIAEPPGKDRQLVPYAAGKLAKDLTLPRLRGTYGWRADNLDGIDEWRLAFRGQDPSGPPTAPKDVSDGAWDEATRRLENMHAQARALKPGQDALAARIAGQASAVCYAWANVAPEQAAMLRTLGRELSRSAQIRAAKAPLPHPGPDLRSLGLLLAAASHPQNKTLYWAVLALQLRGLALSIRQLHQQQGELQQAKQLELTVQDQVLPELEKLRDQHAQTDPVYARELARQRQRRRRQARAARAAVPRGPVYEHPQPTVPPVEPDDYWGPGHGYDDDW